MMKTLHSIIFASVFAVVSLAEGARMWTDVDGTRFEGTFVRELLGRIQVRDTEDKLRMIPVEKLSNADLNYLQHKIVPEVDITVRKKSRQKPEMEWTISGDKTTLYTCQITLEKKSDMDSKAKLTAELYFIADEEDGDNYILIEHATKQFVFPEGKNSQIEWVVNDIPIRRYFAGWAVAAAKWRGGTYLGYIVTVLDPQGEIVDYKTDLGNEDWMSDVPTTVRKLRKLAYEGRGSVYSRHFTKNIEKAKLPRIEWHYRSNFL
ncbi:hypothetical protein [Tichowtungia aerotolerans]|uniref:SLA1 homology domain-containing protein n=1 Tax=Tichowtungia aerotolerans TaxID=2697043 RepID=A0A6P1MFY0_9BACT|nr:hypothetical protein [Tichowtungia aerotolerans]QHI70516.1 hypothetical protein GT409_14070 [Tichowtungia aerotolerans]